MRQVNETEYFILQELIGHCREFKRLRERNRDIHQRLLQDLKTPGLGSASAAELRTALRENLDAGPAGKIMETIDRYDAATAGESPGAPSSAAEIMHADMSETE